MIEKINNLLLSNGCILSFVEKYQMQLKLIAESGINLDSMSVNNYTELSLLTFERGEKTMVVEMSKQRIAIRLYEPKKSIQKIYAHSETGVRKAINCFLKRH